MRQPTIFYLFAGSVLVLITGLFVTVGIPVLQAPAATALATQYTGQELRGRAIYVREGCVGCHTQQVRAVEAAQGTVYQTGDLGPESQPGDYAYQKPLLWGTNRVGPDLTHVASRPYATREWQIAHLKDPRRLTPGTLMPSFSYLSEAELDDLASYLLTLR